MLVQSTWAWWPGAGLEPHRGLRQDPLGLAQRSHGALHRLVAAGVPLRLELLKQPHGVVVELRRPHAQIRLVRRQKGHPGGPVVGLRLGLPERTPNGLAV